MQAISVSTLRSEMKKHIDSVIESDEVIIVTRGKDEQPVVLMSLDEYNSLMETDYLLSTENNRKNLEESIKQMHAGETIPYKI